MEFDEDDEEGENGAAQIKVEVESSGMSEDDRKRLVREKLRD